MNDYVMANILEFTNAPWSWLFPATYLMHIAEEYWGGEGFLPHLSKTRGVDLTPLRFFSMTGFGWVLMIAGILLADRFRFPEFLLVILGAVFLVNGLSHLASGVAKLKYNPGLLTGTLIWGPLGAITLMQLQGSMSGARFLVGMAIGAGIQGAVSLLSLSVGKFWKA